MHLSSFRGALHRSRQGVSVQDVDVHALAKFLDTYHATYHKIKMSELFQLGRERFGEPEPGVDAAIELFTSTERLVELIARVRDYESWEELLFSPRRPAMTSIDDNP
jgi:hypothetical protein